MEYQEDNKRNWLQTFNRLIVLLMSLIMAARGLKHSFLKLAILLGGEVKFESRLNKGSVFNYCIFN
jgi:hypothetical protein